MSCKKYVPTSLKRCLWLNGRLFGSHLLTAYSVPLTTFWKASTCVNKKNWVMKMLAKLEASKRSFVSQLQNVFLEGISPGQRSDTHFSKKSAGASLVKAALRMRILAVLGIEVMACVTILARITRRPPPVERAYTQGGKLRNQAKGGMRAGSPVECSLRGQAARHSRSNKGKANARHQGENDRWAAWRHARQNGNKGQITIPIPGLGSRTPNPEPEEKRKEE